eukprot:TRINITY_DN9184_c0_g2_i1.p1 TRINITY_DN9184_c0_g2~~TRINITY_DN9184_c0_g2_i1.p1  ORF type:complete len:110 (-),score=6.85 TRINITY_DN9184_c0_g2_i1:608-937(-)
MGSGALKELSGPLLRTKFVAHLIIISPPSKPNFKSFITKKNNAVDLLVQSPIYSDGCKAHGSGVIQGGGCVLSFQMDPQWGITPRCARCNQCGGDHGCSVLNGKTLRGG